MARLLDTSAIGPLAKDPVLKPYYQSYGPDGMDDIVDAVQADIAQYLHFDPVLTVHVNEEGTNELVVAGQYAGRYAMQMQHQPLVPGPATGIFITMTFLYAAAFIGPTSVNLEFVTCLHPTAEVYALSPGVPEGLAGISFGAGNTVPNVISVGYQATYAAGYATGLNDPVPGGGGTGFAATLQVAHGNVVGATISNHGTGYTSPPFLTVTGDGSNSFVTPILDGSGGIASLQITGPGDGYTHAAIAFPTATTFGAPPLPATIKRAALFLVREAVLMEQNSLAANTFNPNAGQVQALKDGSQEIIWSRPSADNSMPKFELGYGSPLAKAAEKKLFPLKKSRPFDML